MERLRRELKKLIVGFNFDVFIIRIDFKFNFWRSLLRRARINHKFPTHQNRRTN